MYKAITGDLPLIFALTFVVVLVLVGIIARAIRCFATLQTEGSTYDEQFRDEVAHLLMIGDVVEIDAVRSEWARARGKESQVEGKTRIAAALVDRAALKCEAVDARRGFSDRDEYCHAERAAADLRGHSEAAELDQSRRLSGKRKSARQCLLT